MFYLKQFFYWFKGKNPLFEIFLKGKKVLDMGCGEGNLLKCDKANIYWIDLNEMSVAHLKEQGYKVSLQGVTKTDFHDDEFDVIVSDNVIEHLFPEEAYAMFVEMRRLLRPGWLILLKTPLPNIVWNSFGHIKPYTPGAIKKLFRESSREKFDSLEALTVQSVYYYWFYSRFKLPFFLYSLLAIFLPFCRVSYLIIIAKNYPLAKKI